MQSNFSHDLRFEMLQHVQSLHSTLCSLSFPLSARMFAAFPLTCLACYLSFIALSFLFSFPSANLEQSCALGIWPLLKE